MAALAPTAIYWFRTDLRLSDNPALAKACAAEARLAFVYVRSRDETAVTRWGFPRWSPLRRAFRDTALMGLEDALAAKGGRLIAREGSPAQALVHLAEQIGATRLYCEAIPAPEEEAEVWALRAAGLEVIETWQSTLIDPCDLPFPPDQTPEVFTAFRQRLEASAIRPRPPILAPDRWPIAVEAKSSGPIAAGQAAPDPRTSFPFHDKAFKGSEAAATAHLERYFGSTAPVRYKATRNGLTGVDYSTKLSPWLAVGAVSPRSVFQRLEAHEQTHGQSEGSYWIWFELLWRDFFRFWGLKHGGKLFRARGLGKRPPPAHDQDAFTRWTEGRTGHAFVDAGMRELSATGYLSNRMRQVVASYLVHDLGCDWRAGAAWFEAQLIDYDVFSNQGNWLYLSGRGADPRQGRRFNPDKQACDYDPNGDYRALWAPSGPP